MTSICLIIPFFSETRLSLIRKLKLKTVFKPRQFPRYFEHFIGTFRQTTSVDLKILTNISYKDKYAKYQTSNVTFHGMELSRLVQLFEQKLGLKFQNFRPYKLCDLKPTYGFVFSDYLKEYDFWGYCDIDMVIGNLGSFLTPENLDGYEMVSASQGNPGYMTLYRNTEKMNFLFKKNPNHLEIFSSAKNYRFDEFGSKGIIALQEIVAQESIKIHNLMNLVHNDSGGLNRDRNWRYQWENGCLTDCLTQQEIGSFHLVRSKRRKDFVIEPFQDNKVLEITNQGIRTL